MKAFWKVVSNAVPPKTMMSKALPLVLAMVLVLAFACSCTSASSECYYAYFEDTAFILVYDRGSNVLTEVVLPLEPILLWGKSAGLDSIPAAMRNFVGLKESGFLVGTKQSLQTLRDMLDVMGVDEEDDAGGSKRLRTFADGISVLSKRPLSDNMNKLCGQDVAKVMKTLEGRNPSTAYYDARPLFDSEDLNFSQRYFTQWLGQVLGGSI